MFATRKNTKEGDVVCIPLNNEWQEDEQLCLKYKVVLAFRCMTSPDTIVPVGQEPLKEWYEFHDELAFLPQKEV